MKITQDHASNLAQFDSGAWSRPRGLTVAAAVLALIVFFAVATGPAQAAGTVFLCVPSEAGHAVTSGGRSGSCKSGTTKVAFPARAADQKTLIAILPHVKFTTLSGKPTIRFSKVNVQIVSGSGHTNGKINGLGNLFIGYDEHPTFFKQTGSHNLVLGDLQRFTSYGGIIGGLQNIVSGPFAAAFGDVDVASGPESFVSGSGNTASGTQASILGGAANTANGNAASVSGGNSNTASGAQASILGGENNNASNDYSTVSGGGHNTASGVVSSVFGCLNVTVSGDDKTNPALCP